MPLNGFINIEKSTSNQSLNNFKNSVNEMITATKDHFVDMNIILEQDKNKNKLFILFP